MNKNDERSFNTEKCDGWLSWFLQPAHLPTRLTNNSKKQSLKKEILYKQFQTAIIKGMILQVI